MRWLKAERYRRIPSELRLILCLCLIFASFNVYLTKTQMFVRRRAISRSSNTIQRGFGI